MHTDEDLGDDDEQAAAQSEKEAARLQWSEERLKDFKRGLEGLDPAAKAQVPPALVPLCRQIGFADVLERNLQLKALGRDEEIDIAFSEARAAATATGAR